MYDTLWNRDHFCHPEYDFVIFEFNPNLPLQHEKRFIRLGVSVPEIRLGHYAHAYDMVIHSSQDIVEISTPHPFHRILHLDNGARLKFFAIIHLGFSSLNSPRPGNRCTPSQSCRDKLIMPRDRKCILSAPVRRIKIYFLLSHGLPGTWMIRGDQGCYLCTETSYVMAGRTAGIELANSLKPNVLRECGNYVIFYIEVAGQA